MRSGCSGPGLADDGLLPPGTDLAWLVDTASVVAAAETYLLVTPHARLGPGYLPGLGRGHLDPAADQPPAESPALRHAQRTAGSRSPTHHDLSSAPTGAADRTDQWWTAARRAA